MAACAWMVSTYGLASPGGWVILGIGAFYGSALLACIANLIWPGSGYARVSYANTGAGPVLSPRALRRIRCAALLLPVPLIFLAGSVNHYLQKGPHCYRCYKRKCVAEAVEKFAFRKSVLFDNKDTGRSEEESLLLFKASIERHFFDVLKERHLEIPENSKLTFRVYRDGAIGRVRIEGEVPMDEKKRLLRAIRKFEPFEPLPGEICRNSTYIEVTVWTSRWNVLRYGADKDDVDGPLVIMNKGSVPFNEAEYNSEERIKSGQQSSNFLLWCQNRNFNSLP